MDTTPPWASALLVTLNEMRSEMRERLDALGTQLDRIVDRTERAVVLQILQHVVNGPIGG